MLAGLGRRDALLGMDVARPGNVNNVHFFVLKHVLETVARPAIEADIAHQPLGTLPTGIAHGDHADKGVSSSNWRVCAWATQPAP